MGNRIHGTVFPFTAVSATKVAAESSAKIGVTVHAIRFKLLHRPAKSPEYRGLDPAGEINGVDGITVSCGTGA